MDSTQPIILQEGSISKLQDYIRNKIDLWGFSDETLHERLLLLTEELGELVKSCRKISGMNINEASANKSNVGEEIADVINMIFAVAIKLNIDVEKEFFAKHEKVDQRTYKRSLETVD